jgi:hypothetical protein
LMPQASIPGRQTSSSGLQRCRRQFHQHQTLSVTIAVEARVGTHVDSDDDTGVEM